MNNLTNPLGRITGLVAAGMLLSLPAELHAQVTITGRVMMPPVPGATDDYALTAALVFATTEDPRNQSLASRTWETHPAGWFTAGGPAGNYTVAIAGPGRFMRPLVLTNQFLRPNRELQRHYRPAYDYAVLTARSWDPSAATAYYQTFVARSRSITNIGFSLAHDGVDGEGPQSQVLLAGVHYVNGDDPTKWPRIGPTAAIIGVDSGGGKTAVWGAGWNSGEVIVEPGRKYAICLRAEKPGNTFQCFWDEDVYNQGECYRIGSEGGEWTGHDQYLYVAGDGDGLIIPFNKRVQREYHALTKFGRKWSQTYVAQGRSLASVMFYAAVATSQPWLPRQRVTVRVREGGPEGPVVGVEKIAIGQPVAGAEAGVIGVTFAPGQVPLEPGRTYAVELQAFGHHRGFNPYMKHPRDPYEQGTSYFNAEQKLGYDLDMVIVEYEHAAHDWSSAVETENLLANGDMQQGPFDPDDHDAGPPEQWTKFAVDEGTAWWYQSEGDSGNRFVSVVGGSLNGRTVDGGYVQRVSGLSSAETYRVFARVRCTWPVDEKHQVLVGVDETGQTDDPEASTIRWTTLPGAADVFEEFVSDPARPAADAISVWLRGRTSFVYQQVFHADFDDVALRRVRTSPPAKVGR